MQNTPPHDTQGCYTFFIAEYEVVDKFCLPVLRCKRELIFDLVTIPTQLQTVFSGASCESSLTVGLTELCFPRYSSRAKLLQGCELFPSTLYNFKTVSGALTRLFGMGGKKNLISNTKLIDFQRQDNNSIFFFNLTSVFMPLACGEII